VPVALGGGPYGVVDALYFKLLDYIDLGEPVAPFRSGHNISYMDDRLLERLGVDTRYVWPGPLPAARSRKWKAQTPSWTATGRSGSAPCPIITRRRASWPGPPSLEQIDEIVRWPDVDDPRWTAGVEGRARSLREAGEHYIVGPAWWPRTAPSRLLATCAARKTSWSIWRRTRVRAAPAGAHWGHDHVGLIQGYLQAGGKYFDMLELPGDDYAGNTNLVISPRMFRTYIKPILKRMVNTVKDFRPEIKVMLHSDGVISKLLPDLVEIGVDVVHPLEPLPAMDLADIKARFGDRLAFLGGIDISHAMPGTVEDVQTEARLRISQLAAGGGYILAPANHLQADIPPENVVALFTAAHEYGRYPLE
jgi:uroporphyrinogen decarboxylase